MTPVIVLGLGLKTGSRSLDQSKYLVTGAADNTMRLWDVQTGKCLYVWEFDTAVRWVSFSPEGSLIVQNTEQRMGFQGAIRVFNINREKGTDRTLVPNCTPGCRC